MTLRHRFHRWMHVALPALAIAVMQHAAAHGVSLNVRTPFPIDSAFHRDFLVPWAQKVEKEAGGRMRFHLHPASGESRIVPNLYEQILEGAIDVAWTPIAPSPERFPRLLQMQMPGRALDIAGASRVLWEYARLNEVLDQDFEGVRVLALHYGLTARAPTTVSGTPGMFVFAMSAASYRSLPDDLKVVIDANSGPETSAWLARVIGGFETTSHGER